MSAQTPTAPQLCPQSAWGCPGLVVLEQGCGGWRLGHTWAGLAAEGCVGDWGVPGAPKLVGRSH